MSRTVGKRPSSKTASPRKQAGPPFEEKRALALAEALGEDDGRGEAEHDEAEHDEAEHDGGGHDAPLVGELVEPGAESADGDAVDDLLGEDDRADDEDDPLSAEALALVPAERPAPLAARRDPVAQFVAEARRHPRLSEEEERALIAAVRGQGGEAAARRLVIHNLRLVVSIAYQYRRAWTNMLDLFQEGSVGLMEAVSRWDPSLGTRFGSYAAYWIRAYVLRFLMRNARLIHVGNTRAGRKLFFRLGKEVARLRAIGFEPTPKLLAASLDVAEKDVEEVSGHLASREISLAPRPDEEGIDLSEKLSAEGAPSPEDEAARSHLTHAVRVQMDRFLAGLTDARERAIWEEHLAAPGEPASLSELGKRFGVSKQRMGQLAERLKQRFRADLVAALGPEFEMAWHPLAED